MDGVAYCWTTWTEPLDVMQAMIQMVEIASDTCLMVSGHHGCNGEMLIMEMRGWTWSDYDQIMIRMGRKS
jgi:hypothetical protein